MRSPLKVLCALLIATALLFAMSGISPYKVCVCQHEYKKTGEPSIFNPMSFGTCSCPLGPFLPLPKRSISHPLPASPSLNAHCEQSMGLEGNLAARKVRIGSIGPFTGFRRIGLDPASVVPQGTLFLADRNAGATLTRTGYPATTTVIGVNSRVATVSLCDVRSRNSSRGHKSNNRSLSFLGSLEAVP